MQNILDGITQDVTMGILKRHTWSAAMNGYRETRRELIRENGGYGNLFRLYADRNLRALLRTARAGGGGSLGLGVEVPDDADEALIRRLALQNVMERMERLSERAGTPHVLRTDGTDGPYHAEA